MVTVLTACGGGQSADGGTGIHYPGNLVPDTSSIAKSGKTVVTIRNVGQLPVVINNASITDDKTVDSINAATTDCYGKTLSQNQTCSLGLNVYAGEAGVSTVALDTSNGTYTISLNIDTSSEGVIDSDIKSLQTTKEQVISLVNKGAAALTVTKLALESNNTTLRLSDINCLNQSLTNGQSCQLKVRAAAAQNRQHILYLSTNNKFLVTQQLQINENTDKNMLSLVSESGVTNPILIESPGVKLWTITNSGTDDIHISSVKLDESNIGSLSTNNCDGKLLEAGDSCDISISVNQNAFGGGGLFVNTTESLLSGESYSLIINSNNLTLNDGTTDVVMHTNSNKVLTIKNASNFDIDVNSIDFNNGDIRLSSDCAGTIHPSTTCSVSLLSLGIEDDNSKFIFNEFDGGFSRPINLHISNGITVFNQPDDSVYHNVLPHDNNFYQVFLVTNPTSQNINLTVLLRDTSMHGVRANELASGMFILPSCFDNAGNPSIMANSQCELILREVNDYNKLADIIADSTNPDTGNLRIRINYSSGDVLLQKFQGTVVAHQVSRNPTYPPGALILAEEPIGANNSCGVYNALATIVSNVENPHGNDWSGGFVIQADLIGKNTISVTGFAGYANQCSGRVDKLPFVLQGAYKTDTEVAHFEYDPLNMLSLHVLPGSYCQTDGGDCLLNVAVHQVGINGVHYDYVIATRILNFAMPLPEAQWMVADRINWLSVGSRWLAKSN